MMKNNLYRKGFIVPVLLGIIAVLIAGGGVYLYKSKKVEAPVVNNLINDNQINNEEVDNKGDISTDKTADLTQTNNTEMFKLGTLEFSYPGKLSFNQSGDTLSLSHSVPTEKYVDSCDLKDGSTIEGVSDFNASFKIIDLDIKNSIKKDNPNMLEYIFKGDSIITGSGFVEKYKLGLFDGYVITMGLEGCGVNQYYFPISSTKTLFISKSFPSQTYPDTDLPKLEKIPGYITSTQSEQILKDILSSVTGLENQKIMTVKLYFPNKIYNPEMLDCRLVYPVTRIIPYTQAVATESLNQLIKGPTLEEQKDGYWGSIPLVTKVNSIKIENSKAYVDFNENIGIGFTSCSGSTRLSSIANTLKQFPTIKDVVFSVNGEVNSDALQP